MPSPVADSPPTQDKALHRSLQSLSIRAQQECQQETSFQSVGRKNHLVPFRFIVDMLPVSNVGDFTSV